MNVTEDILLPKSRAMPQTIIYLIVTMSFLIGIIGNSSALVILYRSAKRRNKKHVLMLRWLACNDLTAAIGMLIITNLKKYATGLSEFWICTFFTILRGFGFGSGIVALIMALERWFALTRPFLYYKVRLHLFCYPLNITSSIKPPPTNNGLFINSQLHHFFHINSALSNILLYVQIF